MRPETPYPRCLSLFRESLAHGKIARAVPNSARQPHEFLRISVLRSCTLQVLPHKLALRNSRARRRILNPRGQVLRQPNRQCMTHMAEMYSHKLVWSSGLKVATLVSGLRIVTSSVKRKRIFPNCARLTLAARFRARNESGQAF